MDNEEVYNKLYSTLDSSGGDYTEIIAELRSYHGSRSVQEEIQNHETNLKKANKALQDAFAVIDDIAETSGFVGSVDTVSDLLETAQSYVEGSRKLAKESSNTIEISFGVHDTLLSALNYLENDIETMIHLADSFDFQT